MDITPLIKPLGIAAYLVVAMTLLSGRFRAKLHLKLTHHRLLAYLAILLATVHGALVILFF